MTFTISNDQRQDIVRQIGRMNIFAISGGRVLPLVDGICLPVGCGYQVRVRLTPMDEYTVERVFVRGGQDFSKGTRASWAGVVGEDAYQASCFRNDDLEYWPEALDNTNAGE